jgi:hypothetical protein
MLSEEDRLSFWARAAHLANGVNAVQSGHADVQHSNIGMQRFRITNSFLAVGSFSDYLKLLPLEQGFQALTYYGMIVSEHYFD